MILCIIDILYVASLYAQKLNKLNVKYQSYSKLTKIDTFEQKP